MKTKNKSRLKLPASPSIKDRFEAEGIVNEIALLTLRKVQLTAEMDAEIAAIRAKFVDGLQLNAAWLEQKTEALKDWALANPEEFPKGRKSITFGLGKIGFRTGTPKLALLSRAWTWAKVLAAIKALRWSDFVRVIEEVDKEAILTAHASKTVSNEGFKQVGVVVTQEETFFVDPNLTEVEKRQITEAA